MSKKTSIIAAHLKPGMKLVRRTGVLTIKVVQKHDGRIYYQTTGPKSEPDALPTFWKVSDQRVFNIRKAPVRKKPLNPAIYAILKAIREAIPYAKNLPKDLY